MCEMCELKERLVKEMTSEKVKADPRAKWVMDVHDAIDEQLDSGSPLDNHLALTLSGLQKVNSLALMKACIKLSNCFEMLLGRNVPPEDLYEVFCQEAELHLDPKLAQAVRPPKEAA